MTGQLDAAHRTLKIVVFPLGYVLAHVSRTLEIAKVLRARGHEVVYAGRADHPRSRLHHAAEAGFRIVPFAEVPWFEAWDRFQKHGQPALYWDLIRSQQWAPLDAVLEDMIRVCQEEQPDLILGDSSLGVSTVGHILGIPAAGVLNAYNLHFVKPGSFHRTLIHAWDKLLLSRVRARVFRKHGVPPVDAFELLKRITMLSPDLSEFHGDASKDFPHWHPIGPILCEPQVPLPGWFSEIQDGQNIYITMGSTGLLDPLLRRTYDALGKSRFRFLVTTAGQVSEETMQLAPPNFFFAKYAPGSKLLEHCQAMIFHGGNGSMYQALAAGVPMIALPSHLEQEVCTKMLLSEGFGLRENARRVTGERLLQRLEHLLATPAYRQNAVRLGEAVRRSNAPELGADLLEATARSGVAV